MVAQVIFEDVGGRYKNARAISVIEFNDVPISAKTSKDEMVRLVREYQEAGSVFQPPLFDEDH